MTMAIIKKYNTMKRVQFTVKSAPGTNFPIKVELILRSIKKIISNIMLNRIVKPKIKFLIVNRRTK